MLETLDWHFFRSLDCVDIYHDEITITTKIYVYIRFHLLRFLFLSNRKYFEITRSGFFISCYGWKKNDWGHFLFKRKTRISKMKVRNIRRIRGRSQTEHSVISLMILFIRNVTSRRDMTNSLFISFHNYQRCPHRFSITSLL